MDQRVIVWISFGAASAVAAKLALEKYGPATVTLVYCDTSASEHSDNVRFSRELEKWLGKPILGIRNLQFRTVDEVFSQHRYMSGPKGARCTVEMKKKPRFAFALPDDVHVFGFTADEKRRITDFEQRNPELRLSWILRDQNIGKQGCYRILSDAGIDLPLMYLLGFDNNNCLGCVKATSPWYWDMIRHHFPEVFKRRCEQSRAIGCRLVEYQGKRIFLDELPYGPFKKYGKESISCGPECGIPQPDPMDDPMF